MRIFFFFFTDTVIYDHVSIVTQITITRLKMHLSFFFFIFSFLLCQVTLHGTFPLLCIATGMWIFLKTVFSLRFGPLSPCKWSFVSLKMEVFENSFQGGDFGNPVLSVLMGTGETKVLGKAKVNMMLNMHVHNVLLWCLT